MNFPIKGNRDFLKNLKKGTQLYIIDAGWDADGGKFDVTVKAMVFDHYKENAITSDDTIMAVMHVGKIEVEHNICYGFFDTPMAALEAFKKFTTSMIKATDKAINRENKRLEAMVRGLSKPTMKAKSAKVDLYDKDGNKIDPAAFAPKEATKDE